MAGGAKDGLGWSSCWVTARALRRETNWVAREVLPAPGIPATPIRRREVRAVWRYRSGWDEIRRIGQSVEGEGDLRQREVVRVASWSSMFDD
jgi:hypothetical protein